METARFMANLYEIPINKQSVMVLDAGAGSGILSCAFIEWLERFDTVKEIELTCYEKDGNMLGLFGLKDDGEMVYIIPHSWTLGAYFKCLFIQAKLYFYENLCKCCCAPLIRQGIDKYSLRNE